MPVILSLTILLGLGCLFMGFRALKRQRLVNDLPTSRTQGAFIGTTELKGTAESDAPLTSYLAEARCVYYSYNIEEHWSRTVHETYTDANGKTQTRTRTESGWKQVSRETRQMPFYLKDEAGIIRIIPEGAKINPVKSFDRSCSRADALYYGKGPEGEINNSTHTRRFREDTLPLHATLYVLGQARERQDIAAAEIARDKDEEMYLISTRPENKISSGLGWGARAWMVGGLALAAGTGVVWNAQAGAGGPAFGITIGVYLLLAAGGWLWCVFNSLVNLKNMVGRGWSQVDIQLKRRHDLIPILENTVKGYAAHEKDVQMLAAELRAQNEATPPGAPGPEYKGISPAVAAVIERYPELKASDSFLSLQRALTDTEERIALARDYFNNIATAYNTRLGIIPDRFVAMLAGYRPRALMSAASFERAPVQVKLAE